MRFYNTFLAESVVVSYQIINKNNEDKRIVPPERDVAKNCRKKKRFNCVSSSPRNTQEVIGVESYLQEESPIVSLADNASRNAKWMGKLQCNCSAKHTDPYQCCQHATPS